MNSFNYQTGTVEEFQDMVLDMSAEHPPRTWESSRKEAANLLRLIGEGKSDAENTTLLSEVIFQTLLEAEEKGTILGTFNPSYSSIYDPRYLLLYIGLTLVSATSGGVDRLRQATLKSIHDLAESLLDTGYEFETKYPRVCRTLQSTYSQVKVPDSDTDPMIQLANLPSRFAEALSALSAGASASAQSRGPDQAICDLCSARIPKNSTAYSPAKMRKAVAGGLRPPRTMSKFTAPFGMEQQDVEKGWVQSVMNDSTDWILCAECGTLADGYL